MRRQASGPAGTRLRRAGPVGDGPSMIAATVTLAERPDLVDAMWSMASSWPHFMLQDPVSELWFRRIGDAFPEHQLVALDESGAIVARVNAVPLASTSLDALPDRGWDAVVEQAFADAEAGREPRLVSLVEARVVPERQGAGLSAELLRAARRNVQRLGGRDLVAPVRPTAKSLEPHTPMWEYACRVRDDGLPADPWLRTHVRLGARIVRVCPLSMTIAGTLGDWRTWTGMPLDVSGAVEVPGALSPVHVSVEQDCAVYVEPNVWVHHPLEAHDPGSTRVSTRLSPSRSTR